MTRVSRAPRNALALFITFVQRHQSSTADSLFRSARRDATRRRRPPPPRARRDVRRRVRERARASRRARRRGAAHDAAARRRRRRRRRGGRGRGRGRRRDLAVAQRAVAPRRRREGDVARDRRRRRRGGRRRTTRRRRARRRRRRGRGSVDDDDDDDDDADAESNGTRRRLAPLPRVAARAVRPPRARLRVRPVDESRGRPPPERGGDRVAVAPALVLATARSVVVGRVVLPDRIDRLRGRRLRVVHASRRGRPAPLLSPGGDAVHDRRAPLPRGLVPLAVHVVEGALRRARCVLYTGPHTTAFAW